MAAKILIAYYSWSGHTAQLARKLQKASGADLFTIEVAPGTFSNDMYQTSDRAKAQIAAGKMPELTASIPDLQRYGVVLVGGPVWSGSPSTPVRAFLQAAQGSKAVFAPFYTHAGSPNDYEAIFKTVAAPLTVVKGFGVAGPDVAKVDARMQQWLETI